MGEKCTRNGINFIQSYLLIDFLYRAQLLMCVFYILKSSLLQRCIVSFVAFIYLMETTEKLIKTLQVQCKDASSNSFARRTLSIL